MSAAASLFRTSAKVTAFDGRSRSKMASRWTQANRFRRIWLWWGFRRQSRQPMRSLALPCNDDGSVVLDAQLRVADALYAAGDIARFPYRGVTGRLSASSTGGVAQQHGRTAGTGP